MVLQRLLKFGSEGFPKRDGQSISTARAIAIVLINNSQQQREEKIVCERAHKAGEKPPTAAKPAGGWEEDFVVNNFRV